MDKEQNILDEWKIQIKLGFMLMVSDDNPFKTEIIFPVFL